MMNSRKKLNILGLCLMAIICCCGCGSSNGEVDNSKGPVFFAYNIEKPVSCFNVDNDGNVITGNLGGNEDLTAATFVNKYNEEGALVYEWSDSQQLLYSSIDVIADYNSRIYFVADNEKNKCLYELNTETGECIEFIELPELIKVKKLYIVNDNVFIFGSSSPSFELLGQGITTYENTKVYVYSLLSKNKVKEFSEKVLAMSDTPEGNVMIYTYHDSTGFMFETIDSQSLEIKDSYSKQIESLVSFAYDGKGIMFFSYNAGTMSSLSCIYYSKLNEDGVAETIPNASSNAAAGIFYRNGFTYLWNGITGNIERTKNSAYIKDNKEIRIISSSNYFNSSFSAGYITKYEIKNSDELALAVLSNDAEYDVFYMSTRQSLAKPLKEKGVYYNLEDIPNVREYIESCFDYVKEAATDSEGHIWMIPIEVTVPVIAYNEENCKSMGVLFESTDSLTELENNIEKCADNNQYAYWYNSSTMLKSNIRIYLRNRDSFDTKEFRDMAECIKKSYKLPMGNDDILRISGTSMDKVSFASLDDTVSQGYDKLLTNEKINVCSVSAFNNEKNSAICTYICVNPASDNLEATCDYISSLCKFLSSLKQRGLCCDKNLYEVNNYTKALYKIYDNSVVDFLAPDSIYLNNFYKYLDSDMSLDEFIMEADRQMQIYLNE